MPAATTHRGIRPEGGFTLIELVLVIVIIAIIGTLTVTRLDSITAWKTESNIRKFANLWDTLQQQASSKGEGYRLVIDIDGGWYYVRREVPLDPGEIREVDYLENLRTKGEQERRQQQAEEEQLQSLEEEFVDEDRRKSGALEKLFYQTVFRDPKADVRLAVPLEFPNLAKRQQLNPDLRIRDIVLEGESIEEGKAEIRFSPRQIRQLAVVHFETVGEEVYTLAVHPASGRLQIHAGDIEFEEAFSEQLKEK